jgi:hypothetical protein
MKLKKEIGTLDRIAKRMKQSVIYEKVHHPIIKKFNTQKLQENWAGINERIKPIYADYSVVENQLENLKRLSLMYKRRIRH